jgi:protein SCO1/2
VSTVFVGLWVVLFALAGCNTAPAATPTPASTNISAFDPALPIKNFTLDDTFGKQTSLDNLKGKLTLVTFGFANCPDVCPVTLANFKLVKQLLGERAEGVRFAFVSVDGARDTPEALAKHLALYDTTFLGLTGDDARVRPVTLDFGVQYIIEKPEGTSADYLVTHTASSFLVNAQGQLVRKYAYGTPPEEIAADVAKLL